MNWTFGLPDDIYKLTYFNDLLVAQPGQSAYLIGMKTFLYNLAQESMDEIGSLNANSTNIQNAIAFLGDVALSERKKEIEILKNYKNRLKDNLPKIPQLEKIIDELDNIDIENPGNLDEFYTKLTNGINLVRQDSEKYLTQLKNFQRNFDKKFGDLTKNDFRFRAYGDIQAMLNSLIGTATRAQKSAEDSFSGKIRDIIFKQITSQNLTQLIGSGEDFAAIASALVIDIEEALQREVDRLKLNDFTELTDDMINRVVEEYNSRNIEQQSRLQRAINTNNGDLQNILNNAKSILNIQTITDLSDRVSRHNKVQRSRNPETLRKRLTKAGISKTLLNETEYINFSHKTNTSHGNLYEFIASLFEDGSLKVRGNAATDLISLEFTIEQQPIAQQLENLTQQIEKAYTDFALRARSEDSNENEAYLNEMNATIRQAEQEINDLIKQLNLPIEDIFIYHESLKLYGGMETGEASAFHGRSMVILSAIEELYNAAGLGGYVLPNRDAVELIAYNLSSLAAGAGHKSDLEYIFSIFAGLLMFDDIQNIALEASQQIDIGAVKNIHLYLLNGYYVPASMILSYTYEALTNAANIIENGNAAQAKISTAGADTAINSWLRTRPQPVKNYWFPTAKKVASGTIVQISFLAGFIAFIDRLTKM